MNRRPNYDDIPNIKTSAQKRRETQEAIILADIAKIDAVLADSQSNEQLELHKYLDGKYQSCISNWGLSMYEYHPQYGFQYDYISNNETRENLILMKAKLEAFIQGWNTLDSSTSNSSDVNVTVNNQVNISVTFEQARSQIKDMTSLTDEQTQEILDKIAEIESVYKDSGSKKSKWEKVKPILVWLADKSFDVGMALLPLLLKIQG